MTLKRAVAAINLVQTEATTALDETFVATKYKARTIYDVNGVFLPVNVGGEGYYWGQMNSGYYTFLYFSDSWMKVNWTAEADAEWLLQQTCGLIAVK